MVCLNSDCVAKFDLMKNIVFNKTSFIALLLLCSLCASAQRWSKRRYELDAGVGLTNFMGDICSPRNSDMPVWVVPFKTTGYVADGILKYNFSGRHFGSVSVNMGYMGARETVQKRDKYYYRDGIAFNSFFTELAGRYEFQFIKEKVHRTVYRKLGETNLKNTTIPSYVFIGAGGIFNVGKFLWNDFEGEIKGKDRYNKTFCNVAPVVMGGLGTKLRVDRNTYLGIEAGWRVALNDGIDNCKGKNDPTEDSPWKFGKWFDQYQFIAVNLVFTMREKRNHAPNFKTIRR